MLGRTAGGLFWMFRYLERMENAARLLEAGWRISRMRGHDDQSEWASIITTSGARAAFLEKFDAFAEADVIDYILRDRDNASSVLASIETARSNARMVRTALSREVWEATNDCWLALRKLLARPVGSRALPEVLGAVRHHSAVVRGTLHGTMLRNDIFAFARLGTFVERADNTARILDVKYYVLLPSPSLVGTQMDSIQWDIILNAVSAERAFRWLNGSDISAAAIAEFLILDRRMPRSLRFCHERIAENLAALARDYGCDGPAQQMAGQIDRAFSERSIGQIFDFGLHEFLADGLSRTAQLSGLIEQQYSFYG